jgi:hypothetical protein
VYGRVRVGLSPFGPERAAVGPVRKEANVPPRGLPGNANVDGDDEPARWAHAERMLVAAPELATANLATMAAVGAVDAVRELLDREPDAVRVSLGPHRWEPLLYLTYSRVTAPAA